MTEFNAQNGALNGAAADAVNNAQECAAADTVNNVEKCTAADDTQDTVQAVAPSANYGILVDYEWCTGCHSCEVACQMEHGLEPDRFGVKLAELGPWQIAGKKWQYAYVPLFSDQCDLCQERVALGKLPSCVHHCQAACLVYGTLDELSANLKTKTKQTLFALK
ncbi:MAG: hypothetical protein LBG97_06320 [Coriobacteriales bacterium]|jgi:anaerobic dimethyl sulfoxide reductase subunit B (iron-sulfur subunit)|nr:hypothetical protein [Coriobacteriales bacterium]